MREHNTYLSDEELNRLIADVEDGEMVTAPPDMVNEILMRLYGQNSYGEEYLSERTKIKDINARKTEFRLYCFRVITSVAAAIMLLFVMPKAGELNLKLSEVVQENTREAKELIMPRYATKEEALNDKGIWWEAFGNNKLFGGESRLRILKNEMED